MGNSYEIGKVSSASDHGLAIATASLSFLKRSLRSISFSMEAARRAARSRMGRGIFTTLATFKPKDCWALPCFNLYKKMMRWSATRQSIIFKATAEMLMNWVEREWQWVAKMQRHCTRAMRSARTEQAMAMPSKVEVPRPSSSMMARLLFVPWLRMLLVYSISMKKVLLPCSSRSEAPIRVKMRSTISHPQLSAGTKKPVCASITIMHVVRSSVDLPPMLGPVSSIILRSRSMSLAMTSGAFKQGCLAWTMVKPRGRKRGRVPVAWWEQVLRAMRQSSSASTARNFSQVLWFLRNYSKKQPTNKPICSLIWCYTYSMSATRFRDCSVTYRLYPDRFEVNTISPSRRFSNSQGTSISQRSFVCTNFRLGSAVASRIDSRQSSSLRFSCDSSSCSMSQDSTRPFCGRGMSPSHFMQASNCAKCSLTDGSRPYSLSYSSLLGYFAYRLASVSSWTSRLLLKFALCLRRVSSAYQLLLKCSISYLNSLNLAELTSSKQTAFQAMALTEQWYNRFTIFQRSGRRAKTSATRLRSMLIFQRSQTASRRLSILRGSRSGCMSHLRSSRLPNLVEVRSSLVKSASFSPRGVQKISRCCKAWESTTIDSAEPSLQQKLKRTALMMQSNLRQFLRQRNMPARVARMDFSCSGDIFSKVWKTAGRAKRPLLTRVQSQFLAFMGCQTLCLLCSLLSTIFSQLCFIRSTIYRGRLSGSYSSSTGLVWNSIVLKSQRVYDTPIIIRFVPIQSSEQAISWLCLQTAMRQLGRYCLSSQKETMVPLVSTCVMPRCRVLSALRPSLFSRLSRSFIWSGVSSCSTTTSLQPSWTNQCAYFSKHFSGKPTCILLPIHLRSRLRLPIAASSQNISQNLPSLNRITLSKFQLFMRQYCFIVYVMLFIAQLGTYKLVGSYSA